jgi:hypothetical protein
MPRARSQPLNLAFHHWAAIAVQRDGHFKHTTTRSEPKVTATPGLSEASWTAFFEGRFQSGDG